MFSVSTASTSTIGATTLRTLSTASRPLLLGTTHLILRQACPRAPLAARSFHSTPAQQLKLSLPWSHKGAALKNPADAAAVSKDGPSFATESWPHPVYSREEMQAIVIAHRQAKDWSDWLALGAVRTLRWTFDKATGYTHDKKLAAGEKSISSALPTFEMTYDKWLIRFIFLESVAGVFGMVGGMIRHLHSLRRLRRDKGWIETLLEEAYNERMHLLTFLKMRRPGIFMRAAILGAQGVVFNAFFLAYLVSPRTCHRFVGYLEEEAVITYTRAIRDIESGKLAEWQSMPAPEIARKYWKMGEQGTMLDLLYYIRADEAKHREVNHTLANLHQNEDPNPYKRLQSEKPVEIKELPSKRLDVVRPEGWEREEALKGHRHAVAL